MNKPLPFAANGLKQVKMSRSGSVSEFIRERRGFLNTFAMDSRNNIFSQNNCEPESQ